MVCLLRHVWRGLHWPVAMMYTLHSNSRFPADVLVLTRAREVCTGCCTTLLCCLYTKMPVTNGCLGTSCLVTEPDAQRMCATTTLSARSCGSCGRTKHSCLALLLMLYMAAA